MKELLFMFLQGLIYIVFVLWGTYTFYNVYKEYKSKIESQKIEQPQEEEPLQTNQQPLYILSPNKE